MLLIINQPDSKMQDTTNVNIRESKEMVTLNYFIYWLRYKVGPFIEARKDKMGRWEIKRSIFGSSDKNCSLTCI